MSMTPIHRIPQLNDGVSLHETLVAELRNRNSIGLAEQLESVHCHTTDETHLSIMLDWAMQIRSEFGISWSDSIDLAMVLYFG